MGIGGGKPRAKLRRLPSPVGMMKKTERLMTLSGRRVDEKPRNLGRKLGKKIEGNNQINR